MNTTLRRLKIAIWAARNADVLTMLHFEMLRDSKERNSRGGAPLAATRAHYYAARLSGMPGAAENRAAL